MFLNFRWIAVTLLVSSCANSYRDFIDWNSADYRRDQARNALDNLSFDDAITLIDPVIADNPLDQESVLIGMSAYSGRAGLRSLELFSTIGSESGEKGLFQIFAEHFVSAEDQDVDDVDTAVALMEALNPVAATRSLAVNFFGLFLYYSQIGVLLNLRAFLEDSLDRDPSFSACNVSDETGLEHADVDKIMMAIVKIQTQLSALSSASAGLGGLGESLDSAVPLPSEPIPCEADPSNVACLAVRTMVNDDTFGLGVGEICLP